MKYPLTGPSGHLSPCPGERSEDRHAAPSSPPTLWGRGAEPSGLAFGKPKDRLSEAVRGTFGKRDGQRKDNGPSFHA